MLKLLAEYAIKSGIITRPGFTPKDVNWAIVLDSNKGFLGLVSLGITDPNKKRSSITFPECPEMDKPLMQGKVKRCHFLVETPAVVALYGTTPDDVKMQEKHKFFIYMLIDAAKTNCQFAVIARCLQEEKTLKSIQLAMAEKKVKPNDKVTIQLDGEFPVEQDYWHGWWNTFLKSIKEEGEKRRDVPTVPCFVNGEPSIPVDTHRDIKGLVDVGGQRSGSVLVGFDKDAFCSYGLKQSANAAVCEQDMSAYRAGLNDLIRNHSQSLSGTKVVHWFKEKVEASEDLLILLEKALETPEQPELNAQHQAKKLLESIRTGERVDLGRNYYYVMTLSGNGGRVMVRDWIEGQFEELARNISAWFDDLEIVSFSDTRSARSPKLESVVTCLLPLKIPPPRPGSKDYSNWVKPAGSARVELLRSAIKGLFIPYSIISRLATVHRAFILSEEWQKLTEEWQKLIKGERDASTGLIYSMLYARMGLIKAYHLRKNRKEGNTLTEELKPALNENYPNPAYQCGRLMAVLAELQRAALGDVGAGVIQRYYASASTTPALVLGRLTRTSQFHLSKLEAGLPPWLKWKDKDWYESLIPSIWNKLKEAPPRTLSLEDQSLFALGYYQQLASINQDKETQK